KEHREIAEALILSQPLSGVTYGLYTSERGSGGILTIQCNVRPANSGERHVSVTGQASSMIMGQTFVPAHSVIESAENAVEAGKLLGVLKAAKVKITALLVPDSNYRSAKDEMKMVQDEGIIVHPITNAQDGWPILFDLTSEELAKKIRVALVDRESLVDLESNSSRFLGTGQS